MVERAQAVQLLASDLERLGAPLGLPEDWILLSDHDDLRLMSRPVAKKLLAATKRETARRWLYQRFDPDEMDLELWDEGDGSDNLEFDQRLLKRRAINSIDDVVSTVSSLRETVSLTKDNTASLAHEATVAARLAFGYPKESPSRLDCFDEDVRRQCLRAINEVYRCFEKSSGPVVYVISAGDPKFVKIGFTTSLDQRLRSLRTASHVEPVVHVTVPGTRALERDLHSRFASARYNREWFRVTEEIEAFVASERSRPYP